MSSITDPQAAAQVQGCLKELFKLIKSTDEARKATEPTLNSISSTHKKIQGEGKLSSSNKSRLKSLYEDAAKEASKEEDLLRKSLEKIYKIRQIRHEMRIASRNAGNKETIRRGALMKMLATSAETIPLWVGGGNGESPPALAGAVPPESNYVAACGDMAAALVKGDEGDENWILAEVVSYSSMSGKYEVDCAHGQRRLCHTRRQGRWFSHNAF